MVALSTVPTTVAGCLHDKPDVVGDTIKWTPSVYIQIIIQKEHLT